MNFKDARDAEWIVDKAYLDGDFMVIHVHDKYGYADELRVDISNLVSPCTDKEREVYETLRQVCALECIDGYCPKAWREERCMDVIDDCRDC